MRRFLFFLLVLGFASAWFLMNVQGGGPDRRDANPANKTGRPELRSPASEGQGNAPTDSSLTENEVPSSKPDRVAPPLTSPARREYGSLRSPLVPSVPQAGQARIYGIARPFGEAGAVRAHRMGDDASKFRVILGKPLPDANYELYVPPGRWRIRQGTWIAECVVGEAEERRVDFGTTCSGELEVLVEGDPAYLGLAQIRVVVKGPAKGVRWEQLARGMESGVTRIDSVPCGPVEVTVIIPTKTRGDRLVINGTTTIREEELARCRLLLPSQSLDLLVMDGSKQQPVSGVRVTARIAGEHMRIGFSDERGRISFSHLPQDTYQVLLEHEAFCEALHQVRLGEGRNGPAKLRLHPGRTVEVLVTDQSGTPLQTELSATCRIGDRLVRRRIGTDDDGRGSLRNWPGVVKAATFRARLAIPLEDVAIPAEGVLRLEFTKAGGAR